MNHEEILEAANAFLGTANDFITPATKSDPDEPDRLLDQPEQRVDFAAISVSTALRFNSTEKTYPAEQFLEFARLLKEYNSDRYIGFALELLEHVPAPGKPGLNGLKGADGKPATDAVREALWQAIITTGDLTRLRPGGAEQIQRAAKVAPSDEEYAKLWQRVVDSNIVSRYREFFRSEYNPLAAGYNIQDFLSFIEIAPDNFTRALWAQFIKVSPINDASAREIPHLLKFAEARETPIDIRCTVWEGLVEARSMEQTDLHGISNLLQITEEIRRISRTNIAQRQKTDRRVFEIAERADRRILEIMESRAKKHSNDFFTSRHGFSSDDLISIIRRPELAAKALDILSGVIEHAISGKTDGYNNLPAYDAIHKLADAFVSAPDIRLHRAAAEKFITLLNRAGESTMRGYRRSSRNAEVRAEIVSMTRKLNRKVWKNGSWAAAWERGHYYAWLRGAQFVAARRAAIPRKRPQPQAAIG